MEKEFKTLSEKRFLARYKSKTKWNAYYPEEDIKEFIKKNFEDMEKKLIGNKIKYGDVVRIIKSNAGDKFK